MSFFAFLVALFFGHAPAAGMAPGPFHVISPDTGETGGGIIT